jgi:hypothetical protein
MDINGPAPFGPGQRASYSQVVRQLSAPGRSGLSQEVARPVMRIPGSRNAVPIRPHPPERGAAAAAVQGARQLVRQHAHELRRLYQLLIRAKDGDELARWNDQYCNRLMQLNQAFRALADSTQNFRWHTELAAEDVRLFTEAHLHHGESLLRADAPISRDAFGIFARPHMPSDSPQGLQIKLKLGGYETCVPADNGFLFALAHACPAGDITALVAQFYERMAQLAEARHAPAQGSHKSDKRFALVAEDWRACSSYLGRRPEQPRGCPPLPAASGSHRQGG